jgi:glutathione synthase/RimK-type ligase-like ATP-grasp enzyme
VRALPTQFQAHVPGLDVRVHVAGVDVHATEIRSDAVDYRYAHRTGDDAVLEPHELPTAVAECCRAAATALRLPLCGLDLRRTPDGEYVCFEANPMPAYSYYQLAAGQPIAGSLIRYLAGSEGSPHGSDRRELVGNPG